MKSTKHDKNRRNMNSNSKNVYKIYQERKQKWAARPKKKSNSKYAIEAEMFGKRMKNVQVWKSFDQNMIKKKTNKIQEQMPKKSNSKLCRNSRKVENNEKCTTFEECGSKPDKK